MTAALEIKHILDNWDYNKALVILRKYNGDPTLIDLLSSGETTFFRLKLRQELATLSESQPDQEPAPARTLMPSAYKYEFNQYPEDVQQIIREKNQKVKEIDWRHGQLELMATDAERLESALRILELDEEVDCDWERIRYFEAYNRLPEAQQLSDDVLAVLSKINTLDDAFRMEANYETYVSRAKKGSMKPDKLPFYEQCLEAIRTKKKELA